MRSDASAAGDAPETSSNVVTVSTAGIDTPSCSEPLTISAGGLAYDHWPQTLSDLVQLWQLRGVSLQRGLSSCRASLAGGWPTAAATASLFNSITTAVGSGCVDASSSRAHS